EHLSIPFVGDPRGYGNTPALPNGGSLMSRQGLALLSARPRAAIAISGALVLVMAFAGTVLGHHTLPSATFACDGTATWHVDDWTTDNTHNQALAPDIETWYSLDGGSY